MNGKLNHFDDSGNAVMVDVSSKGPTVRTAVARGEIRVTREILEAIQAGTVKKGDVLGVARVAGIMAVKRTWELIPLCHPLLLDHCALELDTDAQRLTVTAECTVRCTGRTGVEMEALQGVTTALLTVYDMCKALSHEMVLGPIHLVSKDGGKSGPFRFGESHD